MVEKIKRGWWLYKSAGLTLPELFNLAINKVIYNFFWLINNTISLLRHRQLYIIDSYDRHIPKEIPKFQKKRALVIFLHEAFYKEYFIGKLKFYFSNNGAPLCVARAFNELGYIVDVVGMDNFNFKLKKNYDVIFYHSLDVYAAIKKQILPKTTTIFFDTVAYWRSASAGLQKRYDDFNKRHGLNIKTVDVENYQKLSLKGSEVDSRISAADEIIVMGDQLAKTYDSFPVVVKIKSAVYEDPNFKKDINPDVLVNNRKNFLFFGGSVDNIRKGLDLLLESFIGTDSHLYICAAMHPFMEEIYKISKRPNVHHVGYVKLNSKKFYNIINTCDFVIHPSCAEGVPGGVLETMKYGIIPIVSRECNLPEADECGIILPECSVLEIRQAMDAASGWNGEILSQKSKRAVQIVSEKYSINSFVESLKAGIITTVNKK